MKNVRTRCKSCDDSLFAVYIQDGEVLLECNSCAEKFLVGEEDLEEEFEPGME